MASDYNWHPDEAKGGSVFKVETRNLGWWVFLAILASILIHILLYVVLSRWEQTKRDDALEEEYRIVLSQKPTIDRAALNEILAQNNPILDDVPRAESLADVSVEDIDITDLNEILQQLKTDVIEMSPIDAPQFSAPSIPKLSSAALSAADDLNIEAAESLANDLNTMRASLLQESSKKVSPGQVVIEINQNLKVGSDLLDKEAKKAMAQMDGNGDNISGYSSLDDLIKRSGGGLPAGFSRKTLLPSDILFGYNETNLKDGSKIAMVKLAYLISINDDAIFIIEGHTDGFGTDEYNKELSLKRAESVRDWIVKELEIPIINVRVVGKGKSEPLAPLTGTAQEQALNRRVEIEIRKP